MIIASNGGRGGARHKRQLRRMLLASTGSLLLAGAAIPVNAGSTASSSASSATQPLPADRENPEIIVTAPPLFRDVRPERVMDEEGIESYGVSTIDELVAEIQAEIDPDEEPVFLVNGQRVHDLDEIGAYPVEVLRQLQVLPRGSATRFGGSTSQRVISLALHKQMRSGTLTMAPRVATDGNWQSGRSASIFTHVRGQTRGNVALRIRDEGSLLESQRGIIQPVPAVPYAAGGNILAYPDLSGEIDPLLSAEAGTVVTVVPVPANHDPTLTDLAADANVSNVTDLGRFRTLRPSFRNYDLNGSFSTKLAPWLSSTATIRLSRNTNRGLLGLPAGLFTLDPDNPHSPFSETVALAFYNGADPLRYHTRRDSGDANLTLNANFGRWRGSFNVKHTRTGSVTSTDRTDLVGAQPLSGDTNPFAVELGELIPVRTDRARSRAATTNFRASISGSPFEMPAGPVQTTLDGVLGWYSIRSRSSFAGPQESRSVRRSEQVLRGAIEVPLASRTNDVIATIGDLTASAEYSLVNFSDVGALRRHSFGLIWEPRPVLRLRGAIEHARAPASIELLGEPVIVTPDVRIFDPLTGATVDVVQVAGGNPLLIPQSTRTTRLSALLRLVPRLGLQLNGEYADINERDFIASLPLASAAVMLAFPDRFVRDANGILTRADIRPVNFESHRQKRLRSGFSLNAPLGGGSGSRGTRFSAGTPNAEGDEERDEPAPAAESPRRLTPPTRLALTANHIVLFEDEIRIRPGLDPVNLLEGGAIGIAGGRVRHQLDATAGITSGGTGVRLGAAWRDGSVLESRIGDARGLLEFSPLLTLNFRAFADMRRLFPNSGWSRRSRVSLNVTNLTNQRQSVRDPLGNTPLQYQPGYRDPLGRTIEFELRKVF